jgi:purine-binding chemotaxis protein CheW
MAQALAGSVRDDGRIRSLLLFAVAGRRFALPIEDVQEIVRAVTITRLPNAPAVVEGVINVRGRIVPLLDIRARFRLGRRAPRPSDHFVLALAAGRQVAVRVDAAEEFVEVAASDIVAADQALPEMGHVAGVAKLPDGLILIHDLHSFLTEAEALALDESLQEV